MKLRQNTEIAFDRIFGKSINQIELSYMKIRALTPEDLLSYRRLRLESILDSPSSVVPTYEEESGVPDEQMAARLKANSYQIVYGAFQDLALIGVVGFVRDSRSKIYHRGNIMGVYVTPTSRSAGVAHALFEAVIAHVRNIPEVIQLDLKVNTINVRARALYAKMGFVSCGIDRRALCIDGQFHDEERMALYFDAA